MRKLFILLVLLLPLMGYADDPAPVYGIGEVAENLLQPVDLMADFVHSACFLIGFSFLFATVVKYFEHRRSPLMVPISTVVFLLIAGIALILLPFLANFTEGGVHYSLMTGK